MTHQISATHTGVLAGCIMLLLGFAQGISFSQFLVHPRLLPDGKCLWRHGGEIRSQFVSLHDESVSGFVTHCKDVPRSR